MVSRQSNYKAIMLPMLMLVFVLWATVAIAGVNEDFIAAAYRGDLPAVKGVITEGADVNANDPFDGTLLIMAQATNSTKKVTINDDYHDVNPSELPLILSTKHLGILGGKTIIGTVESLSLEGQNIELLNNEIEDGFITTKKYGKFKISELHPSSFSITLQITKHQREELLKLKKKQ